MNAKRFSWMLVVMAVCVALSGCASLVADGAEPAPTLTETPEPAQPVAEAPEAVVEAFYAWYLDYSETGNPMVDEAYKSSEHLTEAFVQEVDELLASFEGGGYDPFLCAQDIPDGFDISIVQVVDGETSVILHQVWNAGTEHAFTRDLTIELQELDGAWKIDGVVCPTVEATRMEPGAVVEAFYAWYLDYSETGNPLVDGAYRSNKYLTEAFVQKVDELIASFDKGGYDPFLCAQDVSQDIMVEEVSLSVDEARVQVKTSFEGHSFDLLLQREGDQWKIADVLCASPGDEATPEASPSARSEIPTGQFTLGFSMPSDWAQQGSEWVWTPVRGGEGRFGVNVAALEPPMEAEAVLLPEPAEALASEPMELDWAPGARSFTIEVYGPAPQGGDEKAPVEAVQKHVLATVHEDGQRTGIDFYVSAPSMHELSALEPLLETVLRSAQLD